MNVLFICNQNKFRSPTAQKFFSTYPNVCTDSAGLYDTAKKVLKSDQLHWADIVFVMDRTQLNRLRKKFKEHLGTVRVINIEIADEYEFMDEELIRLLEMRVSKYLVPK